MALVSHLFCQAAFGRLNRMLDEMEKIVVRLQKTK